MEESTLETDGVLSEPRPFIRLQTLGADNLSLEIRFWTDSRRSDYVLTSSNVRLAVLKRFRERCIPLPDPTVPVSIKSIAELPLTDTKI